MKTLKFYTISDEYIVYMQQFEKHIYSNLKGDSPNRHTYVGILLNINSMTYFAPLVSMKAKYLKAKDKLDIILLKPYAIINLNNMMPVPESEVHLLDFSKQEPHYRDLLKKEWALCKSKQDKIINYAERLYHGITSGKLNMPHCFDYKKLEVKCAAFSSEKSTRNAAYLDKIQRGIKQCAEGRGLRRDIDEV